MEDLLTSFSSESFAVQTQTEKDLRASLSSFFCVDGDENQNLVSHQASNFGSHTTLPNHPWSSYSQISNSNPSWSNDIPPPSNTPMGTPVRSNGFIISTSPPTSYPHCNSPTPSHRTLNDLTGATPGASIEPMNCLACLYILQNPSHHYSHINPLQHQEGCHHHPHSVLLHHPSRTRSHSKTQIHFDPSLH